MAKDKTASDRGNQMKQVNCFHFSLAVILLLLATSANAQGPGSRPTTLPFLLFSPSAAANGMGGGFVAAANEASAIYYNPAALARLGRVAIEGNTFEWLPDLPYRHLSGAMQVFDGLWLGSAYTRLSLGEQRFTGEESPEPFDIFKQYQWALSFAAAARLGRHAGLGAGFKYVRSVLAPGDNGAASTYAFDLGLTYDGFLPQAHVSWQNGKRSWPWQRWVHQGLPPGFSLGVALANLGPGISYSEGGESEPLPRVLRIGLAWNILESNEIGLVATGEFDRLLFDTSGDKNALAGGLELNLLSLGAVRLGRYRDIVFAMRDYNTFGFSIGPPGLRFSYAKATSEGYATHKRYSLSIVLGKWPRKQ
jgi:hypothetical protein